MNPLLDHLAVAALVAAALVFFLVRLRPRSGRSGRNCGGCGGSRPAGGPGGGRVGMLGERRHPPSAPRG